MIASAKRWFVPSVLLLATALSGACGSSHSSGGAAGGGSGGGGAGGGGSGGGGSDGGSSDGASGAGGATVDAGPLPPSCAPGGPGLTTCGAGHESCCTSLLVSGGSYNRTYDPTDGGPTDAGAADAARGSDPATVSNFRLDKYDVTVGRFRQFVKAVMPVMPGDGGVGDGGASDGGTGWRPVEGAGKHAHLAGGLGLTDVGPDAGAAHEKGWAAADDANLVPTDANLRSCGAASTWTPAPGAGEDRPINCITWAEAYAFCIWDGGFLPSEAEWEYAAAGGAEERGFPWGATDPGTMNQYAIYNCQFPNGSQACASDSDQSIAPVGTATLGAGRWGQLDLAGNQTEWNIDWYSPYVSPCADCASLTGGSSRVLRGGSFGDDLKNIRPTYRDANNPTLRNDFIGFRCARSP
jgi:formylglycine-generating enzyme required for sulfatase activity